MSLTTSQQIVSLFAAQAVSEVGATYSEYQANKSQLIYAEDTYNMNSRLANLNAEDAERRGEKEASRINRQTRQIVGAQRSAYAGQNVEVSGGTPALIQAETKAFGAYDAMTVKNNAYSEAYGYKSQALAYETKAKLADISRKYESQRTLVTGALRTATYGALAYSAYKKDGKFKPRNDAEKRLNNEYLESRRKRKW